MVHRGELTIATRGRGTYDITAQIVREVSASKIREGLATIWIAHTSASLIVCENADPSVRHDLDAFMARLEGILEHALGRHHAIPLGLSDVPARLAL